MMDKQLQGRILIVEDDVSTRRILSLCCSQQGFQPLECSSSADALRLIVEPVLAMAALLCPNCKGLGARCRRVHQGGGEGLFHQTRRSCGAFHGDSRRGEAGQLSRAGHGGFAAREPQGLWLAIEDGP
jgi:hypothetical protein